MSKITKAEKAYLKLLDDEGLEVRRGCSMPFANMVSLLPNFSLKS